MRKLTAAALLPILLGCAHLRAAPHVQTHVSAEPPDQYADRDGEKDALADLRKGKSLKLYFYWRWGERLSLPTPGIQSCYEDSPPDMKAARGVFVLIPEANMAEDEVPTAQQVQRRRSAFKFARSYNQATLRYRKSEVLRFCPNAIDEVN